MSEQADLSDAYLGERFTPAEIQRMVTEVPEEPLLLALLQHIRREAGRSVRNAGGYLGEGKPELSHWALGKYDALVDLFWELYGWKMAGEGEDAEAEEE